jgi:hypothetical protein
LTGKMTTATIAEMEARYHWLLALGSQELARAAVSEHARSAAGFFTWPLCGVDLDLAPGLFS